MTLGEFRKATNHLADVCEVRILNDLSNIFSDIICDRVIIVKEGLSAHTEETRPPKVLIK